MSAIKNIIFDLGGVIINLDQPATISAFNGLVRHLNFEKVYSQAQQTDLFDLFDRGQITTTDFFDQLAEMIGFSGDRKLMEDAWNAMLLKVPEHRLNLLVELKPRYRTFLLSNTCEPHIAFFENELYEDHGVRNFEDYFERVYYSCRMGLRKPDPAIFLEVLSENGLKPEETVFIDDSIQHVNGARLCGIDAHLLEKGREVADLLKALHLL